MLWPKDSQPQKAIYFHVRMVCDLNGNMQEVPTAFVFLSVGDNGLGGAVDEGKQLQCLL